MQGQATTLGRRAGLRPAGRLTSPRTETASVGRGHSPPASWAINLLPHGVAWPLCYILLLYLLSDSVSNIECRQGLDMLGRGWIHKCLTRITCMRAGSEPPSACLPLPPPPWPGYPRVGCSDRPQATRKTVSRADRPLVYSYEVGFINVSRTSFRLNILKMYILLFTLF